MHNEKWLLIRDYCLAWTGALALYTLLRTVGTIEIDGMQVHTGQGLLLSPLFGTLFGLFFSFVQMGFEHLYNKRAPLLKLFVFRMLFSFILFFIITLIAYQVFIVLMESGDMTLWKFLTNPPIIIFYGYVILVDSLIGIFRQISLMLGSGNMKKMIKGEFYKPREEKRIFMFLDLKSSTTIAEELGHIKFSRFLQDCFDDLAVVMQNKAEIYQYVGDEAVLTWEQKTGITNCNCLKAFYNFKDRLKMRSHHYESTYGCLPVFKAGLNIGEVTVAEVGKYKKEIAYHGDTINTAARIQSKCNEFESELLISKELKEALGSSFNYVSKHMGEIPLKGKSIDISIFSVNAPE